MILDKKSKSMFKYTPISGERRRLFCLQQNLAVLAWTLYFNKNTLLPISRSRPEKFSIRSVILWTRKTLHKLAVRTKGFILFACYKYQLRSARIVVPLPLYGQICVPVHKGYKIFDLRRKVVIKMFDDDVSATNIKKEIEGLKQISQLAFAPSLRRWNIEERWYEEDYVMGSVDASTIPPDSHAVLKSFSSDVAYYLKQVILLRESKTQSAEEYVDGLIKTLHSRSWLEQNSYMNVYARIASFIDSMRARVRVSPRVCLVLSHGDFCPENMMHTRQGMKLVDWESTTVRSGLFDFYSYFFYRSTARYVPITTLIVEITQALPVLISLLGEKVPDMAKSLVEFEDVYRHLYYIERICMLLEREMTDRHLNILDLIVRFVEAFNCYEQVLISNKMLVSGIGVNADDLCPFQVS